MYVNNVKEAFNLLNTKVQPMIGSAKTYAQKPVAETGDGLVANGEVWICCRMRRLCSVGFVLGVAESGR